MKKIFLLAFFLLISSVIFVKAAEKPLIIFYYGNGCPHCLNVEKYFERNKIDEKFTIDYKEIYNNRDNALEFNNTLDAYGISLGERGVPTAIVNGSPVIGDGPIIDAIENEILRLDFGVAPSNPINPIIDQQEVYEPTVQDEAVVAETAKLNLFILIGAAFVDAINPCEFAVLIILMATVLAAGDRKRALYSGLTFSAAIFISYYLMGFGLYKTISSFELSHTFTIVISLLAIILGLFNLKDFIWYGGGGFKTEVPESWRPAMKKIIHSVASPWTAFLVGFLVSLFLLPCTSGPYIVVIGMLGKEATFIKALWLLLIYNIIFILPMLFITVAAYFGLKPEQAEEIRKKKLRILHLIAGILLIALGIYLLVV